jgi:lambda family phage tail tape measure protein
MVSTAFSGALKDFEKIGEIMAGNKDAANTMGDSLRQAMLDIVDMLPQMLLQAGLQLIFSGNPAMMGTGVALIVASGLVAIGAGAANYAASQEAQTTPLVASAKGNVFASPSLSMYENGVYNTPHYFKFANGGVFGEAGYEAIMPLTRSVSGQLGVRGNVAPVNVQVVNNVGATVSTKETTNADGSRQLQILIDKAVNSAISRGKADKAMGSRYGTRVAATQRM